ncbi:MAG TPA: hypothetical protein VFD59_16635 [Nocardioidaceae bacterium]|nr:hypothetical protein [Nocardioidaceae bacterium]
MIGNGKILAQGTKADLLQTSGTFVKSDEYDALGSALREAGIHATPSGDGGLRTDADPVDVGKVVAAAGVALTELRAADGAGLEEMFLQLTADTQREGVVA